MHGECIIQSVFGYVRVTGMYGLVYVDYVLQLIRQ